MFQQKSGTRLQRLVRKVYSGPLDNVTHYGSLLAIFYCLHEILNFNDYADPKKEGFMGSGLATAFIFLTILMQQASHLSRNPSSLELTRWAAKSYTCSIIDHLLVLLVIAITFINHAGCGTLIINCDEEGALAGFMYRLILPGSFYTGLTILQSAHYHDLYDALFDKELDEAEAGLNEKGLEKPATQTRLPQTQATKKANTNVTANTLVSNPISSAQSLRKISGCMV